MFKQLNQIDRLYIETALNQNQPIRKIAEQMNRPLMTITREIKRNRTAKKYTFDKNQCDLRTDCRKRHACGKVDCSMRCNICHLCNKACPSFIKVPCKTRDRSPYCCNACPKKSRCYLDKYFYVASSAESSAKARLRSSRAVIQVSDLELEKLNQTVSRRLKQGQPLYHILASSDLPVSESTMYRYISQGILEARNIDPLEKSAGGSVQAASGLRGRFLRIGRAKPTMTMSPGWPRIRTWKWPRWIWWRVRGRSIC